MKAKISQKNKAIIYWLLKVFIVWRLALFFFAFLGKNLLPFKYSFPYVKELLEPYGSFIFWSWANFDGVHYIGIAQKGYFAQFTQAFFPFYPLVVRYLSLIISNTLFVGLLVSNIFFIASLYVFYKLIRLDFDDKVSRSTILFLILFPTSFFFGAFYGESLFLFFLLSGFYFLRQKKWLAAGLSGFFASLTRLFGILLLPVFLYQLADEFAKKKIKPDIKTAERLCCLLLPVLGLGIYMCYLGKNFSDPLYFAHAQPAFGAQRDVDKIVLLYQVFYRYFRMLLTFRFNQFMYYTVVLEFSSALLFGILLFLAYLKKINLNYLIFAVPAYLIPTLTGTFSSMPRYVLVLFPCFMVLGMIKKQWLKNIIYIVFIMLLGFSTMLFTRGYWIG